MGAICHDVILPDVDWLFLSVGNEPFVKADFLSVKGY